MKIAGGCYCGEIRFEAEGALEAAFQCHCRECQYITEGCLSPLELCQYILAKGVRKHGSEAIF